MARNDLPPSGVSHRFFDGRERSPGLGAIGPAGLRHVGPAAAALAAEHLRGHARQIDRVEPRREIAGDTDHHAGLAIAGDADDGDDAAADLLLAAIGEALVVL